MIRSKQIQRPLQVLVVDDQEINRNALEAILEEDYEILTAENGQEALDLMREHTADLSLVLLDLMMPVMSGQEVLQVVRDDEALKEIPIIVLTAEKSAELEALQLGAADFIIKPFDMPEVILTRVNRIIELNERRKLISAAETDEVAGIYSRNFFFEYANRLYRYHPEIHLDAVVIDIEQFHSINALHGREFSNSVIRTLGREIRNFLAKTDGIAGRVTMERFAIYCAPQADYGAVLKQFQEKIDGLSPNVNVHLRMGVTPRQEGVEPLMLFNRAATASSKVSGDYLHPLMIYDDEMLKKELLNQRLLNDLRAAVDERQFCVFYQPKYDIRCNPPKLSSAEALIRWKHPELGLVSPGAFIPLFEGNGLIGIVDSYVWKEAAQQIRYWRNKYNLTLPVSVNLSRSDVFDPTLVQRLVRLIRENGLNYEELKLEVTESAYTDDAKTVLDVIRKLRDLGFQIEMDDFGSGYSSLNMLSDMPVDVLKMDMKFIRKIESRETDRRLVSLILDIARYLKVPVVAEGVETEGQLEILREGGCQLVQGYYFSKPLPPEEFEKLIEREIATERNE